MTTETRNIETQADTIYQEKSIQCNIQKDTEMYASQNEMSVYSDENDNKSIVLSESESSSCSDFDSNDNKDVMKSTAFIVFWLSLIILFGKCFTCSDKFLEITRKVHGSLIIMMTCSNGHKNIWRSQPSINCQSLGNIGNSFQKSYIFSVLLGYSVLERPDFTNFRGNIWLVLSKKDIAEKTAQH